MGFIPQRPPKPLGYTLNPNISLQQIQGGVNNLGIVISPTTPIQEAISSLPLTGGVIFLTAGTWHVYTGINAHKNSISLIALEPGATKIVRTASAENDGVPLFGWPAFTFEGFNLEGVVIEDSAANTPCLYLTADYTTIRNCVIQAVNPIRVDANAVTLADNIIRWTSPGVGTFPVRLQTGDKLRVHGNLLEPVDTGSFGTTAIYAADGVTNCTYYGNVFGKIYNVLTYKVLDGSQDAANVGNVILR